jgi:hypothetical protein
MGFSDAVWIETTQEDFADGSYEKNIYASHNSNGSLEFTTRFDLNCDGYIDLFSSSADSITIYWGNVQGYSLSNKTIFPHDGIGCGNCEGAYLNDDEYPEFIATYDSRVVIYWGSASGYSYQNNLSIWTANNEAVYIADLNRDGYLDITVGNSISHSTSSIYWGSPSGYSANNRTDLGTVFGAHNFEVADFNRDGWYDIVVVNNNADYNYIFWGSPDGYTSDNRTTLYLPGADIPHGSSVADLNNDGYLDIIFTTVYSSYSYIYWGSDGGYQTLQILNTEASYGGSSVLDMNSDSYLDIVFFRGRPNNKSVIYWGSSTGFSDDNRTEIGYALSASGGFVADLNGDSSYDIFLNNYYGDSPILWGPDYTTSFTFPGYHDHHAMFREIGNVYNREYYEDYISSVFDAGTVTDWGTIEWDALLPEGTTMLFWMRSGDTPIPDNTWTDWYSVTNGGLIPEDLNARYLQYKARLAFTNPSYLPTLCEVRIMSEEYIQACVRIVPRIINLRRPHKFGAFIKLPDGYNHNDIDVSTVQCEGAPALWGLATPWCYIVLFHAQDLVGVTPGHAVELTVTGQLYDGTAFHGCDTVRVINPWSVTDDNSTPAVGCTPNPCRAHTTINFALSTNEAVTVKIYDINGALVRTLNGISDAHGRGSVQWNRYDENGRSVPAGVYFYKIRNKNTVITNKVVVLD